MFKYAELGCRILLHDITRHILYNVRTTHSWGQSDGPTQQSPQPCTRLHHTTHSIPAFHRSWFYPPAWGPNRKHCFHSVAKNIPTEFVQKSLLSLDLITNIPRSPLTFWKQLLNIRLVGLWQVPLLNLSVFFGLKFTNHCRLGIIKLVYPEYIVLLDRIFAH